MLVWRAFVFSLTIALVLAISSPARAAEHFDNSNQANSAVQLFHYNADSVSNSQSSDANTQYNKVYVFRQALAAKLITLDRKKAPDKLPDNHAPSKKEGNDSPAYQVVINHNVSLPPFERQAASAFGSVFQSEPSFVLLYEFLPEVLGLKYFLAPLTTNNAVPWYLRPDASSTHSRLAGWKDGNTQYTATITYIS